VRDSVSQKIVALSPALDGTTLEHCAEGVGPFSFDAIGEHFLLFL
jgi:hypothetical protein